MNENIYVIGQPGVGNTAAVITRNSARSTDIGPVKSFGPQKKIKIKSWGANNLEPQERELLLRQNNIAPSLISTKRDIILGMGLCAYTREWKEDKDGVRREVRHEIDFPEAASEFFEDTDIDDYLMDAAKSYTVHGPIFTEFRTGQGSKSKKIVKMEVLDCKNTRSGEQDDEGKVKEYYWSGDWSNTTKFKPKRIPALIKGKDNIQDKCVMHKGNNILFDGYYYTTEWWSGKTWIELSNIIPLFHLANLEHGYNIRYHIEIPSDYFLSIPQGATAEVKKNAINDANTKEAAFIRKLNDFLAGAKNAGRAVVTKYEINKALGKDYPGIKITPISADLKDEALLKLFDKANQANISSQGIHPTLANIESQGKLSSGSEIRNALAAYITIKTPMPRKLLLQPIEYVKKINGWPEHIFYGFKDMLITNLDEDKSGVKETTIE